MSAGPATTLVAPAAAVDLVVGGWRRRFDPWAVLGVPAHVTLLGPGAPALMPEPAEPLERMTAALLDEGPDGRIHEQGRFPFAETAR